MINHFRDQMPRPLVGIGHSMGAAELSRPLPRVFINDVLTELSVHLSIIHPRLLSTLILMEPVIQKTPAAGPNAAFLATYRPDLGPPGRRRGRVPQEQVFPIMGPSSTYKVPEVRFCEKSQLRFTPLPRQGGLLVPVGAVTLATTKHQEAWSYVRPNFEPQAETGHPTSTDRLLSPIWIPKPKADTSSIAPSLSSRWQTCHSFDKRPLYFRQSKSHVYNGIAS
jgi:hypothetical protein